MSKKQLVDQSAHFIAALVILIPAMSHPSIITGALAGFGLGFVREMTEEGTKITLDAAKKVFASKNSMIDIAFWVLGGAVAGLLV
jgi:hypothetical protein